MVHRYLIPLLEMTEITMLNVLTIYSDLQEQIKTYIIFSASLRLSYVIKVNVQDTITNHSLSR